MAFNVYKALSSALSPLSCHTSSGRPVIQKDFLKQAEEHLLSGTWSKHEVDSLPSVKPLGLGYGCWFLRSIPAMEGHWILLVTGGQSYRQA